MTEEEKKKISILLLTDQIGSKGNAGILAYDYYKAFSKMGYKIDILTSYQSDIPESHLYVFPKQNSIISFFKRLKGKIERTFTTWHPDESYYIRFKDEQAPPISVTKVVNKVNTHYDLVLVVFWNDLISFKTILSLYNKTKASFFFLSVDDSTLTGGCHYMRDCKSLQNLCESCPAVKGSQMYKNMRYRMEVNKIVNPEYFHNSYCASYLKCSPLVVGKKIHQLYPLIDENLFKPSNDISKLKSKYGVSERYSFIMFAGAKNIDEPRKGIKYLENALDKFAEMIPHQSKDSILLLLAGDNHSNMQIRAPFDSLSLGMLDMFQLSEVFAMSSVFLSPSVLDAGPMMVNQSLSCGTPVVSFNIGTALDVVDKKGTGFCAKLKDSDGFAEGIYKIFSLSEDNYRAMRKKCRDIALETTSTKKVVDCIINIFSEKNDYE